MTCEQFRELNAPARFVTMNRAERAACCAHYITCKACEEWIDGDDAEIPMDVDAMFERDTEDDEFNDVVEDAIRKVKREGTNGTA